MTTWT